MTYTELYNKYEEIQLIEDNDLYEDEMYKLDKNLMKFIDNKYPELKDLILDDDYTDLLDFCDTEKGFVFQLIYDNNVDVLELVGEDRDSIINNYIENKNQND